MLRQAVVTASRLRDYLSDRRDRRFVSAPPVFGAIVWPDSLTKRPHRLAFALDIFKSAEAFVGIAIGVLVVFSGSVSPSRAFPSGFS